MTGAPRIEAAERTMGDTGAPGHPALSVVIPAYDEAVRLPRTLAEVADYLDRAGTRAEVIVVDDGSRDGTSDVVRRAAAADPRVRLIRLPVNSGKGYAVRVGVLSAAGARVLFADADGSTPIEEVERLSAALDAGAALAIGSRERRESGVVVQARLSRRIVGRTFHQIVRFAGVRGIADTQCGFKLFPASIAAHLFSRLRLDGYAFDVELLLLAQRAGLAIAEVPVNWTHRPGSKVNVALDGLRMARDVLRVRSNLLRGAYDRANAVPLATTVL